MPSSIDVVIRGCAQFKDPPTCLNGSICASQSPNSDFIYAIAIVAAVVCCVGVINNVACLAALLLRHRFTRDTTHRLVVTGAFVDFLVVLTGLLISLESSFLPLRLSSTSHSNELLQRSTCAIISCLHLYRTWVALLIAFERYLLVRRPLFFRAHWTLTTVNILLLVCAALVLATRAPLILNVLLDRDIWYVCTPLARSMNTFIDLLFQTIIPIIILPIMSIGVYMTMRKSFRWRGGAIWTIPTTAKHESCKKTAMTVHKATMTVLMIYIILMIPTLPGGVLRLVMWLGGIRRRCKVQLAKEAMDAVGIVCSLLISSVDFYIYLLCWPRFQKLFTQLVPIPKCKCHGSTRKVSCTRQQSCSSLHTARSIMYGETKA
ncbi:unnamed protein product [Hydatigera taeniaeformis]|uniref:G_PROTEIN_RECEP_F1_2 domain-containing protein n=1 Tax=Hydatigena taeniaeformis TaxID=6205 RepID=A0A0R3WUB7_HYDTA|nr:unnamed protein product [Hydatigera taeniaeformis]